MNIFVLSKNMERCAIYHCDKHIVKMPTETAQLLSSAYYATGEDTIAPYKKSHFKHPQAIWCRECIENWNWLAQFGLALYDEYQYRYGKIHKGGEAILYMVTNPPNLPHGKFSYPPQCMPDKYKQDDIVDAYRTYYNGEKRHIFKWTNRDVPSWVYCKDGCYEK